MKLTKQEQNETIYITLGRLKTSIMQGTKERSLVLLAKIIRNIETMESNLPKDKKTI